MIKKRDELTLERIIARNGYLDVIQGDHLKARAIKLLAKLIIL